MAPSRLHPIPRLALLAGALLLVSACEGPEQAKPKGGTATKTTAGKSKATTKTAGSAKATATAKATSAPVSFNIADPVDKLFAGPPDAAQLEGSLDIDHLGISMSLPKGWKLAPEGGKAHRKAVSPGKDAFCMYIGKSPYPSIGLNEVITWSSNEGHGLKYDKAVDATVGAGKFPTKIWKGKGRLGVTPAVFFAFAPQAKKAIMLLGAVTDKASDETRAQLISCLRSFKAPDSAKK